MTYGKIVNGIVDEVRDTTFDGSVALPDGVTAGWTYNGTTYLSPAATDAEIEHRRCEVSHVVDWMTGNRRFPGEYRFPRIATIIRIEARVEHKTHCTWECRYYISSRTLTAEQAARAVRAHWQIENALHWVLDVTFKEDLARVRKGHGAQNMAIVRHFAINIVRNAKDKRSIKLRRKIAGWDTKYLEKLITG